MKVTKRKIELEFSMSEEKTINDMIRLVKDVISDDEDFAMCEGLSCEYCPLQIFCESTNAQMFADNLVRTVEENKC